MLVKSCADLMPRAVYGNDSDPMVGASRSVPYVESTSSTSIVSVNTLMRPT